MVGAIEKFIVGGAVFYAEKWGRVRGAVYRYGLSEWLNVNGDAGEKAEYEKILQKLELAKVSTNAREVLDDARSFGARINILGFPACCCVECDAGRPCSFDEEKFWAGLNAGFQAFVS